MGQGAAGRVKRWDGRSGSVGGVGGTGCCGTAARQTAASSSRGVTASLAAVWRCAEDRSHIPPPDDPPVPRLPDLSVLSARPSHSLARASASCGFIAECAAPVSKDGFIAECAVPVSKEYLTWMRYL